MTEAEIYKRLATIVGAGPDSPWTVDELLAEVAARLAASQTLLTMHDVHAILHALVGDDFVIDDAEPGRLRVLVSPDVTDHGLRIAARALSDAMATTVSVKVERRCVPPPAGLSALPWPWRACKGGRVLAANGETVAKLGNRREAVTAVREAGTFLRAHGLIGAAAADLYADDERPQPGEIVVNGQRVHIDDTQTTTVDELIAAINAQTTFAAARSVENPSVVCLQLNPGLVSVAIKVSGDD